MPEILYNHALVVGGSGMLSGASLHLANSGVTTSVVGRDPSKIKRLQEHSFVFPGKINPVISDYTDLPQFVIDVIMAQEAYGPISLVVVWMHDTANSAPFQLAKLLNKNKCRYIHVLGSAYGQPDNESKEVAEQFSTFENLDYHQVILGFKIENGKSRWLTNREISDGVVSAIMSDGNKTNVGQLTPWEQHP